MAIYYAFNFYNRSNELKNANKRVNQILEEKDILSVSEEKLNLDFNESIEFKNFNFSLMKNMF